MSLPLPAMTMSHNAAQQPASALLLFQPGAALREWEPPITSH